jgi:hypothetical protein
MTKSLLLATSLLTTLFLSGCGESTNEISDKDKVIVLHDVGITGCTLLENFGNSKLEEQDVVENTSYTSTDNDVSCSTYGKTRGYIDSYDNIDANMDIECAELTLDEIQEAFPEEDLSFYENKDKACVLSFDLK